MTGIFNSSFTRKFFYSQVVFLFSTMIFQQESTAQVFQSSADGEWNQSATWVSSSNCNANQNISQGIPPISKDWGCPVEVTVNHNVSYTGNADGFGSGVFTGIHIGAEGSLTFQNNVTISGGGSVPYITLDEGAELIVDGTLTLDRNVSITIPNNAKMIINNLVIGDNKPEINVEEGGELIVRNTTTLESEATLNVAGNFQTGNLTFSSGGEINGLANTGKIDVVGNLLIGNGQLNMDGTSLIHVGGTTTMDGNGSLDLKGSAYGRFKGDMSILGGSSISATNSSGFLVEGNLFMNGGAEIDLTQTAEIIIQNNVILPNGEINLNNNSGVFVGGKLTASNGGKVNGRNFSSFYLCDYQNSTKETTDHINLQNNSFYGQGCFALPVVWRSFDVAKSAENKIDLNWKTSKEKESSHYEVERSIGGIQDFKKIGRVNAAGWTNSETSYHFSDEVIPTGDLMVYYRLRQVDYSGGYQYSEVKAIKCTSTQADTDKWIAFPNPTNGESLNVKLASGNVTFNTPIKARLLHGGQSEAFEAVDGLGLNQWLNNEIKKAPKGICVLELAYGGNIYHIKVIKI